MFKARAYAGLNKFQVNLPSNLRWFLRIIFAFHNSLLSADGNRITELSSSLFFYPSLSSCNLIDFLNLEFSPDSRQGYEWDV